MPTITEATKGKEADHGYFWNVKLSDGREAWGIFVNDLATGEEMVIEDHVSKAGKKSLRAKRPEKEQGESGGYQPSSNASSRNVQDDPVQRLIVRQSAIKAAVKMVPHVLLRAEIGQMGEAQTEALREEIQEKTPAVLAYWIDWFERKTFEVVDTSPAVSTGAENGRSEGSSSSGTGGEPSGAPSAIDLLKARLEYKVDPDVFSMLVTSVGAESVQGATEEQRAEIMAQLAGLAE